MLNVQADFFKRPNTGRNFLSRPICFLPKRARTAGLWRQSFASLITAIVVVVGIVSFSSMTSAQVRFGSVVGTVTDASGAALSGATVKLTNVGTNEVRTARTSSAGTY